LDIPPMTGLHNERRIFSYPLLWEPIESRFSLITEAPKSLPENRGDVAMERFACTLFEYLPVAVRDCFMGVLASRFARLGQAIPQNAGR
jgi:hypothetical protein